MRSTADIERQGAQGATLAAALEGASYRAGDQYLGELRLGHIEAALFALQNLDRWKHEKRRLSLARLEALHHAMARNELQYQVVCAGAFFAYVRHPHAGKSASEVARRLADEYNMLCLPGTFFGSDQESYLRFSFANVEANRMNEIAARLVDSQDAF